MPERKMKHLSQMSDDEIRTKAARGIAAWRKAREDAGLDPDLIDEDGTNWTDVEAATRNMLDVRAWAIGRGQRLRRDQIRGVQ